jgi:hypothetical protein
MPRRQEFPAVRSVLDIVSKTLTQGLSRRECAKRECNRDGSSGLTETQHRPNGCGRDRVAVRDSVAGSAVSVVEPFEPIAALVRKA